MKNITFPEAVNQFKEIIEFQNLCSLTSEVYNLAFSLKEIKETEEREKLEVLKSALLNIGLLADSHSKILCEIATRHKILIDKIEKNIDQNIRV